MYIQSCYINLNTKNLRDRLREIGYNCAFIKDNDTSRSEINKHNSIQCVNESINGKAVDFYENPNKGINCGTNQDLFLALAGLQDDRMANQWYISDKGKWYLNCGESRTHEDLEDFINLECDIPNSGTHWHKATVEEIIDRFKN